MCGSLFLLGALAPMGSTARAEIVMSGAVCHQLHASDAPYISHIPRHVFNTDVASHPVLCSLPRASAPPGTVPTFRINGSNNDGTSTTCTVEVRDYWGDVRAFTSFTNPNAGPWSKLVPFDPALVSSSDYFTLICRLPGNSGGGIHRIATY